MLGLSISAARNPKTACVFDDCNRQAEELQAWGTTLWKNGHTTTPLAAQDS